MQSTAKSVDAFLAEQPEPIRNDLEQLRFLVHREAPDAREEMRSGTPVFTSPNGSMLCGFMAQKHNLAFYVGRVPDELRAELQAEGCSLGKGTVRFGRLDAGKLAALRDLLREVIARQITC